MAPAADGPKRRRRFTISLRLPMLLVLLAALPMGWKVNRAHTQRRAVAILRAANEDIWYDFQSSGAAEPPGPAWLRWLIGDEYFQEVVRVTVKSADPEVMAAVGHLDRLEYLMINYLGEKAATALAEIGKLRRLRHLSLYCAQGLRDDMLASLSDLPDLDQLYIFDGDISDAGLARLGCLPNLETLEISSRSLVSKRLVTDLGVETVARSMPNLCVLYLNDSDVTDASLETLGLLEKLKTIRLSGPRVTDVGLARLSVLQDLEALILGPVAVTDEGLKSIRRLSKLKILNLDSDRITDAGLAQISSLTNLEHLLINSSAITDAGMGALSGLTKLMSLDLARGQITDAGLARLKALTALYSLGLEGTQVTRQGVGYLKKTSPRLNSYGVR